MDTTTTQTINGKEYGIGPKADLYGADLQRADLQGANLQGADLQGANLDYSCWPLWCGSYGVKVDKDQYLQLLDHLRKLDYNGPKYIRSNAPHGKHWD